MPVLRETISCTSSGIYPYSSWMADKIIINGVRSSMNLSQISVIFATDASLRWAIKHSFTRIYYELKLRTLPLYHKKSKKSSPKWENIKIFFKIGGNLQPVKNNVADFFHVYLSVIATN
jgi:hypothetical protein